MNIEEVVFEIISNAGFAKSLSYEALELSISGKIEEANNKLKEAESFLLNSHKIQTSIIQNEARGNKMDINVLFIHAEDHLMSAIEIKNLIERLIKMNDKLNKLESKKC